jgi:hypothetical protein
MSCPQAQGVPDASPPTRWDRRDPAHRSRGNPLHPRGKNCATGCRGRSATASIAVASFLIMTKSHVAPTWSSAEPSAGSTLAFLPQREQEYRWCMPSSTVCIGQQRPSTVVGPKPQEEQSRRSADVLLWEHFDNENRSRTMYTPTYVSHLHLSSCALQYYVDVSSMVSRKDYGEFCVLK